MKTIAILTPTRARPFGALKMIQSVIARARFPECVKIWLWIDEDDPMHISYFHHIEDHKNNPFSDNVVIKVGPRQPLGKCLNELAQEAMQTCDILMMGNDDVEYKSNDWDEVIRDFDSSHQPMYIAYPDDMNDHKCTFPIVPKLFVETLGYFVPEIFEFLANDTYIEKVGQVAKCLHYLETVKTDHQHFAFGKSKIDQTYAEHRKSGATKRDVNILNMNQIRIDQDAFKLKDLIMNIPG